MFDKIEFHVGRHRSIRGKRVIGFARSCSPESIQEQSQLLRKTARAHNAELIGIYRQKVSLPDQVRAAIEKLIKRKQSRNDFEMLLAADRSCLGRGGVFHVYAMVHALQVAGITVAFADDLKPSGKNAKTATYQSLLNHV
jgi:hypothetical protein